MIQFLASWACDPNALDWIREYKAKRLAERNELVSIGMARHAVHKGCSVYIKVHPEFSQDAHDQIVSWFDDESLHDKVVFYSDGKIFLRKQDGELFTILKTLYT